MVKTVRYFQLNKYSFLAYTMMLALLLSPRVATAQANGFMVDVVAEGLDVPWSIVFAPDGRLFVSERPGRIRVVNELGLVDDPWITLPTHSPAGTEAGLMGLAIDPSFVSNGYIYACYSFEASAGQTLNRVVRLEEMNGVGSEQAVLVDSIPGGRYHNGCRLGFGPDGMLYASTGDATNETLSQNLESLAGKFLRMRHDGSVPADNPFQGSLVWSYGHRNAQGFTWIPGSNDLWATEHGSDGYNELNRIVRGGNYGWPIVRSEETDARYVSPALDLREIPPAGIAYVTNSQYGDLNDRLVFGVLGTGSLMTVRVDRDTQPSSLEELIDDRYGRLRDVVLGPDGFLYVATSNRDQIGDPGPRDDRILRVRRPGGSE